jgi:hypothetical protein
MHSHINGQLFMGSDDKIDKGGRNEEYRIERQDQDRYKGDQNKAAKKCRRIYSATFTFLAQHDLLLLAAAERPEWLSLTGCKR